MAREPYNADDSVLALIVLINGLAAAVVCLVVGFSRDREVLGITLAVAIAVAAWGLSSLCYRIRGAIRRKRMAQDA